MKGGLALILGKGPPKGGPMPDDENAEPTPDDESSEGESAKQYARIAAEAIADKDFDAAADALVSLVKAC